MGKDEDIARLLPDPPPPRPSRRDETIALAMRRFDGEDAATPAAPPRPAPASTRWWSQRGGQIGAFASIALVATIALSVGLQRPDEAPAPPNPPAAAAPAAPAAQPAAQNQARARPAASAPAAAPPPARVGAPSAAEPLPLPPPAQVADETASAAQDLAAQKAAPAPAPAPAAPALASAGRSRAGVQAEPNPSGAIVVTGNRRTAPAMESATPVTVVAGADFRADDDAVVVTGARIRPRKSAQPGDWNACTVNDPRQSLRNCKRLVDPGRKGDAGVAAARLADGLERAWRDDWHGAIAAIDQAIALQPRNALAYLNRGLAHAREDELEKAVADLDRAIRYAPRAARNYYNRGVVRRMRGDDRGADADAARAAQLDSRYEDLAD